MKLFKKEPLNSEQLKIVKLWGALGGCLLSLIMIITNYNYFLTIALAGVIGLIGWIVVRPKLKALGKNNQTET